MEVAKTEIEGVLEVLPRTVGDARGYFLETFNALRYAEHGITDVFVQDNLSRSEPGALRGLHLQHPRGQAKLVWVIEGSVYDVAVDLRVGSPTFGAHVARVLDATRKNQLFIPRGFAHGFCVVGDSPATFAYKCSDVYSPRHELGVQHADPTLGIAWPVSEPRLSEKDRSAPALADISETQLPRFEG